MTKMTDEFRVKVEEALAATNSMRKQGLIDEDTFHKNVVCLAYEYANAEEPLLAAAMVQMIPLSYFQGPQAKQMAEDQNYMYVAWMTAKLLVEAGVADLDPIKTTMPMGNA